MKVRLLALSLCLLLAACSSGAGQFEATDFDELVPVQVTFQVLLPEKRAETQPLFLTLLDPLTGELINPQYFEMIPEGERSYKVTIEAAIGSLLHYRYAKGSDKSIFEDNLAESGFTHRIFYVDGPGHVVTDVIPGWNGDSINFESGSVYGQITSMIDGNPLPNIVISISGLSTRTDEAGEFEISGLSQGLHNLVAYSTAGKYEPFQQGALIAAGAGTPAVFAMSPSDDIPVSIFVTLPEDSVPGIPIFMITNLDGQEQLLPSSTNAEGQAIFELELPSNQDVRYKFSLGDGFWNAEHLPNGEYIVRQVVLDEKMASLVIRDQIASWQAPPSAPIWFEASAQSVIANQIFIQFRFADWTEPIQMWSIGENKFAYKLNSPTNFAAPLEYRYCQDVNCLHAEQLEQVRSIQGNLSVIQYVADEIAGWQE